MDSLVDVLEFYRNKTVFITGHTGFKGSWLSFILYLAGAKVIGYALQPDAKENLFSILKLEDKIVSIIGDIRDFDRLKNAFDKYKPDIVFHLAAQPIVRQSYLEPLYTYEVNVIGTANVCECVRLSGSVRSFLNVTTDKVYENKDLPNYPFKEDDKLDGYDPYSNSKSCSELVTHSYIKSFFNDLKIEASTARAGNVIGGGDFAKDRIIPDCFRAIKANKPLIIRNPNSTRPYQHVFEPLSCYLMIAKKQYFDSSYCGAYNIGPDIEDVVKTEELAKSFFKSFSRGEYIVQKDNGPHEASFLILDNTKFKSAFSWKPILNCESAVELTAMWYKNYFNKKNMIQISKENINIYFGTHYD